MGNVVSVSSSFDPFLSRFLDCTIRRAKHVRDLKDNPEALETELQQLIQTKNDVTRRVRVDEQNQMQRMDRVQGWLQEVQHAEAQLDKLLQLKSQQTDKLCLGGYCSKNCKSSYEYGKQVAKKLKDVAELRREGAAFQQVTERVPDDVADEIPLESTILGLESTFDKVWKCLVGEEVGIIGIYGTGGVGKTTLLKQINNKFCNELQSFDVVIWVVVSRVPNFEKIQDDIGEKIGLKGESWKTRSLQKKAGDIFKILSSKKFVLLLDDIWSWINLTEVGVPIPNLKSVSKVVFTTRSFEVCGSMKADKYFKVEYLRDKEAWKLFEENLQTNDIEKEKENYLVEAGTRLTQAPEIGKWAGALQNAVECGIRSSTLWCKPVEVQLVAFLSMDVQNEAIQNDQLDKRNACCITFNRREAKLDTAFGQYLHFYVSATEDNACSLLKVKDSNLLDQL
ncbi:hypothetical protein Patl1_21856 [Pistacia atlantica]|uniref:Uncharacterized protein n=1 Tax=Pistacia atlantica TaxID=434234 RepID=A0ACC1BJA0_9ROSI|nr:hypothetical protein Patl1_21856 [Pistacia atlantica]